MSVIIRVRDDLRIARCIASIDEDVEIVVVLNTPTAEVRQIVQELAHKIEEIETNNLARAYNVGIQSATHDRVLLMDSDCIFQEGTIRTLHCALDHAPMAKGHIQFHGTTKIERLIALSREYHVSDIQNAYAPALAFCKEIRKRVGGYFFDEDLFWTEDHEFDQRVQRAEIPIRYEPNAIIRHAEISLAADCRSTFHYGAGYYEGVQKRVTKPGIMYGGQIGILRSVAYDSLRICLSPFFFLKIAKRKGISVAAYMIVWMGVFACGYYAQAFFDILEQHGRRASSS